MMSGGVFCRGELRKDEIWVKTVIEPKPNTEVPSEITAIESTADIKDNAYVCHSNLRVL